MNYYDEIKNILVDNEIYKKVKDYSKNRNELEAYYYVGKLLSKAGKHYGKGIIGEYAKKLTKEFNKNYSIRVLYKMIAYFKFVSNEKLPTVSAKISWSHYDELLSVDDGNKINYYINVSISQNLSVRELREKIKSNEYERLDEVTINKLINNEKLSLSDEIKHPIRIKNKYDTEIISEKMLKQLILEDISNFMKELGEGYAFIDSEYKIKIGNVYNYIDILLFNYKYNSFVVIELKVTELKKEHIGQIHTYMNYIDKENKNIYQNKTIGIIIVRRDNQFIMEYCSDSRIYKTTYQLM